MPFFKHRKKKKELVDRLRSEKDRLMEQKHILMEDSGCLKEQIITLKTENKNLLDKSDRLIDENAGLAHELNVRSNDLSSRLENALADQAQSTQMAESIRMESTDLKHNLLETNSKLLKAKGVLKQMEVKCGACQEENERLTKKMSQLEIEKDVVASKLRSKKVAYQHKFAGLRRSNHGKDLQLSTMREERSKALMQLWQMTYGQGKEPAMGCAGSANESNISDNRPRQIPLATVQPYSNDMHTCRLVSQLRQPDMGSRFSSRSATPDYAKNKKMAVEFELFREKKKSEISRGFDIDLCSTSAHSMTMEFSEVKNRAGDDSDGESDFVTRITGSLGVCSESSSCSILNVLSSESAVSI